MLGYGYAIVSIDYRLAPETKLPGIIDDLRDAFRWVREQGPSRFGIDPERIGCRRRLGRRLSHADVWVRGDPASARAGILLGLRRPHHALVRGARRFLSEAAAGVQRGSRTVRGLDAAGRASG